MGDEIKVDVKPTVAVEAKLVDKVGKIAEKTIEKKEEKKKRGRKPIFKPTQFDLDLLHLLREGGGNVDELVNELGVAKNELVNRLQVLKTENLATEENDAYKLTVNGYNFYTSKGSKKVSLKKAFTGEVKLHKHRDRKAEKKEEPVDAQKQKHVDEWLSATEVVDLGGKLGKMDLEEIIKRYGPTAEQREKFIERKVGEVVQTRAPSTALAEPTAAKKFMRIDSNEVCDLCKSSFKFAVSDPQLAKYGHCFCGAAYHKECYDSLLADSAQCIRCGKKLFLIIDKQSREVINKIKDVFE